MMVPVARLPQPLPKVRALARQLDSHEPRPQARCARRSQSRGLGRACAAAAALALTKLLVRSTPLDAEQQRARRAAQCRAGGFKAELDQQRCRDEACSRALFQGVK
jgi:hypothetical protein